MNFINQILQGVLLGGFYALLACGLSFLFGVMRIINLAHGSLAVLAAFLLYALANVTGYSPFTGLLLVVPVMALIGWALQFTVLERSLQAGPLIPILSTFGIAIILDNAMFCYFGANSNSLGPFIGDLAYGSWNITSSLYIGQLDALIFVTAIAVLGALQLVLSRTALGRVIRATAEDPAVVGLIGIDAKAVYAASAAMAVALTGLAGAFLGMRASFDPYAGGGLLLFAFETVVIGGAGSLWGTLAGGIILGVAQNIGAEISPHGFLIAGHSVFLAVLMCRSFRGISLPRGLRRRKAAA
jgi:branched-chain amino acid transport system permease protein